jgi:hypothetical protein
MVDHLTFPRVDHPVTHKVVALAGDLEEGRLLVGRVKHAVFDIKRRPPARSGEETACFTRPTRPVFTVEGRDGSEKVLDLEPAREARESVGTFDRPLRADLSQFD